MSCAKAAKSREANCSMASERTTLPWTLPCTSTPSSFKILSVDVIAAGEDIKQPGDFRCAENEVAFLAQASRSWPRPTRTLFEARHCRRRLSPRTRKSVTPSESASPSFSAVSTRTTLSDVSLSVNFFVRASAFPLVMLARPCSVFASGMKLSHSASIVAT